MTPLIHRPIEHTAGTGSWSFLALYVDLAISCCRQVKASLYLVSLHLQHTLGHTPLQAGLALAPQAAATALGGVLAPLSLRRMTTLTAVRAALVLQGAGLLALVWNDTVVLVPIALVGLGYGTVGTLATTALFEAATPSHAAQAGAIQEVAFALGSGAGIAFFSAVADVDPHSGFFLAVAAAALLTAASAGIPTHRSTTKRDVTSGCL